MDIQQLRRLKILLIGDSCTDVYNYGTCDRLSPEAPVPILKTPRRESKPGMAMNVRENLEGLGHEVYLLTNEEEITKERFIDKRTMQHLLRVDSGEEQSLKPLDERHAITLRKGAFDYDCIVVSDYDKGFIRNAACTTLLDSLRKEGVPIFVDSKKTDLSCYEECIVKVNELEYSRITSPPLRSEIVVTLGNRGAKWMQFPEEIYEPEETVEVFDVCGAGDTFMSALVTAYMSSFSIPSAISFANKCAGISVKNFGNYAISLQDLD